MELFIRFVRQEIRNSPTYFIIVYMNNGGFNQ